MVKEIGEIFGEKRSFEEKFDNIWHVGIEANSREDFEPRVV